MSNQMTVLKEVKIFDKDFRVYGDADHPLFLAKDVAEWIDYAKSGNGEYDVSSMLQTIDEDEKTKVFCTINGRKPTETTGLANRMFLTEQGLYEILMQSRKPIARDFKKQVKSVLRQIRTTGGYIPIKETDTDIEILSKAYLIVTKTLESKDKIIKDLQPKAEQYDKFLNGENYQTMNEVAKIVGCGRNKLFEILRRNKVLMDGNIPYQRFIESQLFTVKENVIQKGNALINTSTTYVSAKGVAWIEKLLATRASMFN